MMSIVLRDPFRSFERMYPLGWEPFQELESWRREMDRMFGRLMPISKSDGEKSLTFMPSAEMDETDQEIHLKFELPGLDAKDLDIEVTKDAVYIRGERKTEIEAESEGTVRSEFHYGKFERVIPMPSPIKTDNVQAEYNNGVLSLTLSKSEEDMKKSVKVEVS
ncbi:heat shock protein Hsp20, putative (plasmid) [Acaryochloris marina MBIC11017]|uniref:Heat shock protein Hsp20, putative n=2 Tax=Acaryochloridaceae TaxID=1890429 RepID=A8ZNQ6_ACAM1|nr:MULTISPECIES: Hsp20/alpha crystallin family protein [Acaryochloris]ABW32642.1 heat shock protein Hsp20, putative [Acaryochloris marina MBIC11017]